MAEHNVLYKRAFYYDIALNRDVSQEVDFIQAAFRHYNGRELNSVLELACGPGYHTRALARRGLRVVGLDLQAEMLAFAQEQIAAEALPIEWLAADMRSFQLDTPVDMVIGMFDSLDALVRNEDVIRHFRTVAANLTPGGLYLIDLSHPRDVSYVHYGDFCYSGQRDGIEVDIVWAVNDPRYDLATGVAHVVVEMHVREQGEERIVPDEADERLFYPQEISLMAEISGGLQVAGWHGNYDVAQPLDFSPASQRMIGILQKR